MQRRPPRANPPPRASSPHVPPFPSQLHLLAPDHTPVWAKRTDFFHAEIVDLPDEGRALFLDSVLQSTAASEGIYHHALIGPALEALAPDGPRDVLILGAGECATVRDVLDAPGVRRVVAVDIDGDLIDAVREYMPQWHAGALDDPRVELRIEDARKTLAGAPDASFDLVVIDLTDPPDAELDAPDVAPAIDVELLRTVRRIVRDGGVVTAQVGENDPPAAAGVVSPLPALRAVFDHVTLSTAYIPAFDGEWCFALARP